MTNRPPSAAHVFVAILWAAVVVAVAWLYHGTLTADTHDHHAPASNHAHAARTVDALSHPLA